MIEAQFRINIRKLLLDFKLFLSYSVLMFAHLHLLLLHFIKGLIRSIYKYLTRVMWYPFLQNLLQHVVDEGFLSSCWHHLPLNLWQLSKVWCPCYFPVSSSLSYSSIFSTLTWKFDALLNFMWSNSYVVMTTESNRNTHFQQQLDVFYQWLLQTSLLLLPWWFLSWWFVWLPAINKQLHHLLVFFWLFTSRLKNKEQMLINDGQRMDARIIYPISHQHQLCALAVKSEDKYK